MLPPRGEARWRQQRICALAMGLGDKAVSLLYERVLRQEQLTLWVERCEAQISGVLAVLEKERAAVRRRTGSASASAMPISRSPARCALSARRIRRLFDARYPALQAHAARCEALPEFQEIVQPLAPPKG